MFVIVGISIIKLCVFFEWNLIVIKLGLYLIVWIVVIILLCVLGEICLGCCNVFDMVVIDMLVLFVIFLIFVIYVIVVC